MTQDPNPQIAPSISDAIGDRIRDLRTHAGLSRPELAEAAQAAGAPAAFSGTVVRFLESGRPGRDGRRTRHFTVDELFALAAALEVTPRELLGDQAVLFTGDPYEPVPCPNCSGAPGQLETTVRADIDAMADLLDLEPSLAQTAYVLAAAIDAGGGENGRQLPALSKQLLATLTAITAGRRGREEPDPDPDDDELDGLDQPD
jgi:transcriptional regulator with XRE-family HTH domain